MNDRKFRIERILHAYVDDELDISERRHTLLQIETDPEVRERVCELRRTKEWVKYAFEGEKAPTRSLPSASIWNGQVNLFQVAASILLLLTVFATGWFTHAYLQPPMELAAGKGVNSDARHVILHIGKSEEARFSALLEKAGRILETYSSEGVQVEVVTNAGGLDLVRTASSQHVEAIKDLISRYENVHFIACSKGLERLQRNGQDVELIQGVSSHGPAADHLIQRLTEGWTLIRI